MPEQTTSEQILRERGLHAPDEKKSKVEQIKARSSNLRGAVFEEITDASRGDVSEDSLQLMKHFGMYQQDNRDTRIERRRAGEEKDFSFMIRTKVPGGVLSPEQYLVLDDIADQFGNGSLRLTTRQTIQFHGVGKTRLRDLVQVLNTRLLTTYGACGDVVRNTMSCPVADIDGTPGWRGRESFPQIAREISERFLPKSAAYYEIFVNGERAHGVAPRVALPHDETDELYGTTLLPRKFKIGLTIPEDNCVDVFTQDLGIVAIRDSEERIEGFNLIVGGGLGASHSRPNTFPRLGDALVFVQPDELLDTIEQIILIQKDFGNRLDRKNARIKYLIAELGIEWMAGELSRRLGREIEAPRHIPESAWQTHDHLGWHEQRQTGLLYAGVFIENGRLREQRGAIREIVERFGVQVRLTGQQNLILANVREKDQSEVDRILKAHGISIGGGGLSQLRRNEMSCVSLPTCGLALAEAERYSPALIGQLEELGFGDEDVTIRISGCPNSCSRAPAAEIGLLGCAPGKYNLYIGGSPHGVRLNHLYREKVTSEELPGEIARLLQHWREQRNSGERFGDFAHRIGVDAFDAA